MENNATGQPTPQPELKRHPNWSRIFITAIIVAAAIVVAGFADGWLGSEDSNEPVTERPTVQNDGNDVITKTEADIANVVNEVKPSVVSVVSESRQLSFYGTIRQEGAGTGIIISDDGYILTNRHVIEDATNLGVITHDGQSHDNVKVVGKDPLNDLAVIKIEATGLKPATLGDSSSVRVGQQVLAIGNSLGQYQNTVTSGIISGTGRPVSAQSGQNIENLTDLLQTDAAINPGNSGGPLINLQGQVIGINTAVAQDAQGIGFAIPINAAKGIIKTVSREGEVRRSYLGVNFIQITPEIARVYDLPRQQGAYIFSDNGSTAVASGSPADKAGIKARDIVISVNGVAVGPKGSLATLVAEYAPGDTIELVILRGERELTVRVTLGTYSS